MFIIIVFVIIRYFNLLILENNIVNELVEQGLVAVKSVKSNNPTPDIQTLLQLQTKAKDAKVGKWGEGTIKVL